MRIGVLAPPYVAVPPKKYGGTERVIGVLVEQLVQSGHDVTLFASGDSQTSARLVPIVSKALWQYKGWDPDAVNARIISASYDDPDRFDIIHNHLDHVPFAAAERHATPTVTTLHGRQDLPNTAEMYQRFPAMPLVSISDSQRAPVAWANWVATVYNGVDLSELPYSAAGGDYLLFVGRISPEKGLDRAIRIARQAGVPIRIAAREPLPHTHDPNVRADWEYYDTLVKPLLREPGVEFVGEVDAVGRAALMGGALALINPIQWDEPFGLVMAESLACGTPVLAMRRGSAPEIVEHGVTGFLGTSDDDLIAAIADVAGCDRRACRSVAEDRFSAEAMARGYEQVFLDVLDRWPAERAWVAGRR